MDYTSIRELIDKLKEAESNSLEDSEVFNDVPSIDLNIQTDESGKDVLFMNISTLYHGGDNEKISKMKGNDALQQEVMQQMQVEVQNAFRKVIHSILGEPFGLDEKKGTCCHKCGHVHVKGTPCPKPYLTGDSSCARKQNEIHTMNDDGADEFHQVSADVDEEKKGLWANIRAKRARGEKPARKGSDAYEKAVDSAEKINAMDETDEYCPSCLAEYLREYENKLEEAEYQGRKVKLGKPFLTPDGPKKRSVYVKNEKGNVVKVNFGDPNLKIKKNIPARRKSFRARHNCDNPGPRTKARYWSCKAW